MRDPLSIGIARLPGTDDDLVRIEHTTTGEWIVFRVCADPTVGQFTTWDVSSELYGDWHDAHDDRAIAQAAYQMRPVAA